MITKSNLLLTRAAMTLLMMVFTTVGAWALEYYVDAATEGNAGEPVENLFDGDVNTKWCVTNELPIYVEFHTDVPIPPTEYVLTTANDCTANPGRNPKSWALYGKVSENDEWVLLHQENGSDTMQDEDFMPYIFTFTNSTAYQYFRFEITEVQSGNVFQLSEFSLQFDDYNLSQASVVGLQQNYPYTGSAISLGDYTIVDCNGDTIDNGFYNAVITNGNGETVGSDGIVDAGIYTLTITPNGDTYYGSVKFIFNVCPWTGEGGWCGNPDANRGANVYFECTEENGVKTLSIRLTPNRPADSDFSMEDDHWFRKDFNNVVIADGVTSIGKGAFKEFSNLSSVSIPNSVTSIGYGSFMSCRNLASVTIPNSVSSIGGCAFQICGLVTVTIPNSVSSIGNSAFSGCGNLATVTIGSGVLQIGSFAFWSSENITDVYCYADPTTLTWNRAEDSFADNKATLCHVFDKEAYDSRWNKGENTDVRVTFVGDLTVRLLDIAENNDMIDTYKNTEQSVTLVGRTLNMDNSWHTLCLPFSLSDLTGTPLEGFTVKELDTETEYDGHKTGIDGETLYLNFKDANNIVAGKPYIVKKLEDSIVDEESTPVYTATSGTEGSTPSQNYTNLIDGRGAGYTWRTTEIPSYCEFHAKKPVYVTGYKLTTGNQSVNFDPRMWTLQAKLNASDAWTVIDSRNANENASDALPGGRTVEKDYTVQNPGAYQYFRFEVAQTNGAAMCLTELTMQGKYFAETSIENPVFEAVTINNAAPAVIASEDGTVSFTGTYSPFAGTDDHGVLFLGAENMVYDVSATTNINAFRAFFQLQGGIIPGDVDGDGVVDVADFTLMANYLLGKSPQGFVVEAADVAGGTDGAPDGDIDIADLTGIANIILHGSQTSSAVTAIGGNVGLIYGEGSTGPARSVVVNMRDE